MTVKIAILLNHFDFIFTPHENKFYQPIECLLHRLLTIKFTDIRFGLPPLGRIRRIESEFHVLQITATYGKALKAFILNLCH